MKPLRVYLSYCQADQAYADTVRGALVAAGAHVWHDTEFTEFTPRGAAQIYDHQVFIPIISPAAVVDARLRHHWDYAARLAHWQINRLIFPMLAEPIAAETALDLPFSVQAFPLTATDAAQAAIQPLGLTELPYPPTAPAALVMAQARALLAQQRYVEAEGLCRRLTQLTPAEPDAWALLGYTLDAMYRFADAVAAFDQALAIQEDSTCILHWKSKSLLAMDRNKEALAEVERAITADGKNPFAYNLQGMIFGASKQYERCLQAEQHALTLDPTLVIVMNNIRNCYLSLKRNDDALAMLARAREIDPQPARVLYQKGVLYQRMGNINGALQLLAEALALDPTDIWTRIALGGTLTEAGRPVEGLIATDQGLAFDPLHAELWNNRGWALLNMGKLDDALLAFARSLAINPWYSYPFSNTVLVLRHQGRYPEALAACDQRLGVCPDDEYAWLMKRDIFNQMGRHRDALLAYGRAIKLNPEIYRRDQRSAWRGKRTWVTVALVLVVYFLILSQHYLRFHLP